MDLSLGSGVHDDYPFRVCSAILCLSDGSLGLKSTAREEETRPIPLFAQADSPILHILND